MKLEQGDYLESNFKDIIRNEIHLYETIWGKFIGHDGLGRMIHFKQLNNTECKNRENFAEYFYTCMESFICLYYIKKESNFENIDINNPIEYLNILNAFISFYGHCGRIRDNAEKMLNIYKVENKTNLINQFQEVYEQRHLVLHGKKLPIFIEDRQVLIAPPTGTENQHEKFDSTKNWSDFDMSNLQFIKDEINDTYDKIKRAYNNVLGNLQTPIEKIIKNNNIDLDNILKTNYILPTNQMSGFQGIISSSFQPNI